MDPQTDARVETLVLPLSGWLLQWRNDDHWRSLLVSVHRDELAGPSDLEEPDWVTWTGTDQLVGRSSGHGHAPSTWWLLFGELREGGRPALAADV